MFLLELLDQLKHAKTTPDTISFWQILSLLFGGPLICDLILCRFLSFFLDRSFFLIIVNVLCTVVTLLVIVLVKSKLVYVNQFASHCTLSAPDKRQQWLVRQRRHMHAWRRAARDKHKASKQLRALLFRATLAPFNAHANVCAKCKKPFLLFIFAIINATFLRLFFVLWVEKKKKKKKKPLAYGGNWVLGTPFRIATSGGERARSLTRLGLSGMGRLGRLYGKEKVWASERGKVR